MWQHRLTADKMEIKDFPKSRQGGTSFIRNTLSKMLASGHKVEKEEIHN